MPSDMMFNPVTDNFTNIQPAQPQPAVCPPAPVSVSNTHPVHLHIFYFSEFALFPIFHDMQDANTDYSFTFGTPGRGYFFGARVNPANSDYLDMRLEGEAEGWVAIGFTETNSMVGVSLIKLSLSFTFIVSSLFGVLQEESDVIGCKRDPNTAVVTVLDSWNPGPQRSRTANQLDENQVGLCQFEAQFVNGRISCT